MAQNKAWRPAVHSVDLNWSSQPAVLHRRYGKNIRLSENNTVAELVNPQRWGDGVVMTAEPVPVGGVFQVTVLKQVVQCPVALVSVVNQ